MRRHALLGRQGAASRTRIDPITLIFDTLKLSKDLQGSFTPEQSEALARVLGGLGSDQIATKADIGALRAEIVALRADINADIVGLRAELKGAISLLRADTIKWIVTAIGFNFAGTAGLIIGLAKAFAH